MQPRHEQHALSQHHFPCRHRVLQEHLHPALFSPSPGTKACPGSSPDHICPLSPGPARAPPTGLNFKGKGRFGVKKGRFLPFQQFRRAKRAAVLSQPASPRRPSTGCAIGGCRTRTHREPRASTDSVGTGGTLHSQHSTHPHQTSLPERQHH